MNISMQHYGLDSLSLADQLTLAEQLWDNVARQHPLTDAQRTELERRIAMADADPNDGTTWEEIRAEARARWQN